MGAALRWRGILGLNYHRIGDGRRSIFDRGLYSATAEDFDRQMRWTKAHFDVIAPADIPLAVRARRGRHVLVTFDDGYRDNYLEAFPILRRHGLTATFFIATGFIDSPHLPWWDEIAWMVRTSRRRAVDAPRYFDAPVPFDEPEREQAVRTLLRAYKRLAGDATEAFLAAMGEATGSGRAGAGAEQGEGSTLWMTWDMIREMHAGGMTMGGHTVSHPVLSRLSRAEQRREIETCKQRIEAELGAPMRAFAYPVGSRDAFDATTRQLLREAQVTSAYSYYGGMSRLSAWDDLDVRRVPIEQEDTFDEFRARVMLPWAH